MAWSWLHYKRQRVAWPAQIPGPAGYYRSAASVVNHVEQPGFTRASVLVRVRDVRAEMHRIPGGKLVGLASDDEPERAGQHHQSLGGAARMRIALVDRLRSEPELVDVRVGGHAAGGQQT